MNNAYNVRPIPAISKPRKSYKQAILSILIILVIIAAYVGYALLRPLPAPKTTIFPPVISAQVKVNVPWPAHGQAAFGAQGYGLLATHDVDKPVPTASTAKVITALAVLQQKPLKPGQQGPTLTMTAQDVARYQQYAAEDGSVVPVYEGQTFTEYQALQAMMLPSANNIADTTAIWAFGSMDAYHAYATNMIKKLGLTQTTIGTDASGFSPTTVSTAPDLVKVGTAALDNPVLGQIVGQSEAIFPGVGTITNVNTLLGQYGIRGIKTGNTDEAGGCFLGAADITVAGQKITVITAVMGTGTLGQAIRATVPLVQSAVSQFQNVHVVKANQSVGSVTTAWGDRSDVVASSGLNIVSWVGTAFAPTVEPTTVSIPAPAGTKAGTLKLTNNDKQYATNLQTDTDLQPPTAQWRLTHPF